MFLNKLIDTKYFLNNNKYLKKYNYFYLIN